MITAWKTERPFLGRVIRPWRGNVGARFAFDRASVFNVNPQLWYAFYSINLNTLSYFFLSYSVTLATLNVHVIQWFLNFLKCNLECNRELQLLVMMKNCPFRLILKRDVSILIDPEFVLFFFFFSKMTLHRGSEWKSEDNVSGTLKNFFRDWIDRHFEDQSLSFTIKLLKFVFSRDFIERWILESSEIRGILPFCHLTLMFDVQ